jgi:hypothetical protein
MKDITPQSQERGQWTSASSAGADKLCPGRHQAQAGIPNAEDKSSLFGDAVHQALAKGDPAGLSADQESIYLSVLEIEKKLCVKFFGPEVEGITPNPVREKRYWSNWADPSLMHSGQVDRAHRKQTKALIVDIKSLAGEVAESPTNMQLRDLACLFDMNSVGIVELGVAIIQPLVTHSPEICVYSRADLMKARTEMYLRVEASNRPNAPRIPGPVQCKFCRAKSTCREHAAYVGTLLPAPRVLVDVPIAEWTPEQRQQFCDTFDIAQKWLDAAWDAMVEGARKSPDFVPGYKLKENPQRGTIINLQRVFDRASALGVPLADFLEVSTIGKGNLKELLRKFAKLRGKQLDAQADKVVGEDEKLSEASQSLKKV